MIKKFRSALSVILCLALMLSVAQLCVYADSVSPMTIAAESKTAMPGSTVDVGIVLKDNPGVASVGISIEYDEDVLMPQAVEYNMEMGGTVKSSPMSDDPITLLWVNHSEEFKDDAVFATVTFRVNSTAQPDMVYPLTLSYKAGDIYNISEQDIECKTEDGAVTIANVTAGDINNDSKVNNKDVSRLMQYLAHWDVEVNEAVLDTNGDKKVNNKDVSRLMQYLAHWNVELHPNSDDLEVDVPSDNCDHKLVRVDEVMPTCSSEGHKVYWQCSVCGKKFKDVNGTAEAKNSDIVLPKTEHTVVADPAVAPTATTEGKTEGSHCAVCGEVIVPQQTVAPSSNYIIYNVAGENPYLQKQIINNPNPVVYSGSSSLKLKNITCPGYQFLGWYDLPDGDNAENIKEIPAGTSGEVELYAWWKPVTYQIEFESELITVPNETYTVEHNHVLPSPSLSGYVFAGWSDDSGKVIKTITEGTTGHKTFAANWISERNQAWTSSSIGTPTILEDEDSGTIQFAYKIGEIRNVPVSVIHNFGYINSDGVEKEVTAEVSKTIDKEQMDNFTSTVQKMTTDSYGITLADGWSEGTQVDEGYTKEKGITTEEVESYARNDSSNWYVSSGKSGYDTTVELDTKDKYNLKTTTKNTKTYNVKEDKNIKNVNAKLKSEMKIGAEGKMFDLVDLNSGYTYGGEIGGGIEWGTTKKTGTEKDKSTETQTGDVKHTGTETTHSSAWNSESGFGGSSSVTQSQSLRNEMTERLSSTYNIGKSYIKNSQQSSSQGFSTSDSASDQYSSSVTYSEIEYESTTTTFKTTNTKTGYHRWIMAGTAHVFGVVVYDIKTSTYYTYTMSVMDDEVSEFEDYSYSDSSFTDNQNSVITFEIPIEVEKYVISRVCGSDGLEISKSGVVTNYSGTDDYVIIPEYAVQDNRDGTKNVIKVTGITEDAFKNADDLYGVILSDFITEIPKNAFADKSKLEEFGANSISSIGDNAFKNCGAISEFIVGDTVKTLGENVVEGLDKLTVYAANADIVEAAVRSGAKEIVLTVTEECTELKDTVLELPDSTESFTFNGMGKTFENVAIQSDAGKTVINRANFVSTGKTPLRISSPEIELNEVSTAAPGIALIMSAPETKLSILGTVSAQGKSGKSALCRDLSIGRIDTSITSEVEIGGATLICGEVKDGSEYIKQPVNMEKIDEQTFEKYLKGAFTAEFDANGGVLTGEIRKDVLVETPYGELPTPKYDYHKFLGWFTSAKGGVQVTDETVFNGDSDVILYAHWTDNDTSDWILVSEMPEDAKVADEKWTYDLTTKAVSNSETMDGFTQYDSSWEWGEYGAWSDWQNGEVSESDSRQVETTWITNYKTQYNYSKWTSNSNGTGWTGPSKGTWGGNYCGTYVERGWSDTPLSVCDTSQGFNIYGTLHKDPWYNQTTRQVENGGYNRYRYRDRDKVYTYYFTKTEQMESPEKVEESIIDSAPSESVTNVRKWVRCINK